MANNTSSEIKTASCALVLALLLSASCVLFTCSLWPQWKEVAGPGTALTSSLLALKMQMSQPVPGHRRTSRLLDLITSSVLIGFLSGAVLQPARGMSPVDELIANMSTWNLTSEEFFKKKLLILHRRYCFSSRLCFLNLPVDSCDYCAPCQCDEDCHHYNDCCPDKLFLNVDEVPPLNLKLGCRDNLYVDYPPSRRETLLVNATSYFMKDSCPPTAPATLAANCRNNVDYLPVSVLTNMSGHGNPAVTVFPSKHCAACNGFGEEDMVIWKVLVGCKSGDNRTLKDGLMSLVTQAVEDPDCILTYHPPRELPLVRTCHSPSDMVTSCNVTGAWSGSNDTEFLQRACAAYLDPKVSANRTFQNVFCYLCNFDDPRPFHRCWRSPQIAIMPFSALLDFSDIIFGRVDRSALCQSDQVYDEEKDLCRLVRCSRGRQYVRENCVPVLSSGLGLAYTLYFHVDLDTQLTLQQDVVRDFPVMLQSYLLLNILKLKIRFTEFVIVFDTTDENSTCSANTTFLALFSTLVVTREVSVARIESQLLSLRNTTLSFGFRDQTLLLTTRPNERVWLNHFRHSKAGGACTVSVSIPLPVVDGDETLVYTRVNDLLPLPQMALLQDEYNVDMATLELAVPWLKEEITLARYSLDRYQTSSDGSVLILLSDFLPKVSAYNARHNNIAIEEAEVIISLVCTSLSLVGLALTFLTYAVFKSLQTAPGKNNMNLAASLFLAQLFYLTGSGRTEIPGVCQALAILIHYFWLAAFCAMFVCSYHMWRVFTSLRVAHDNYDSAERRRQLLQYAVVVWGGAAVVVLLTLLSHIVATGGVSTGYGGRYCYLSSALSVAVAVGVPVAIMVTCNLTFFVLAVRAIRAAPKLQKSREDERHLWVYMKLSSLTGLTWALAFVAFTIEVPFLRLIFTVVNSLQGIFLFLSFIVNRRVMALYMTCMAGTPTKQLLHTGSGLTSTSSDIKTTASVISYSNNMAPDAAVVEDKL